MQCIHETFDKQELEKDTNTPFLAASVLLFTHRPKVQNDNAQQSLWKLTPKVHFFSV